MATARQKPGWPPDKWEMRQSLGRRDPTTGRPKYASRIVYTTSQRVLNRALAQFETECAAGTHATVPKEASTVGQLLDRYMDHVTHGLSVAELAANPSKGRRSPATIHNYEGWIRRDIRPTIGHLRLAKLSAYDLDRLYDGIIRSGRHTTALKVHRLMHVALGQAVAWGWLSENPADRATTPVVVKPEVRSPEPEVVRALIAAVEDSEPDLATFLFVAADSGARRGEVCGLHWYDVDWEAGAILVRFSVGKLPGAPLYEKDTKTHAERYLPLSAGTMEALRQQHARMVERATTAHTALSPTAYVFSRAADGSIPLRPDSVTQAFCRVRARLAATLGDEGPGIRAADVAAVPLKDLRHFVGTQLERAGRPLAEISTHLGHARQATTEGFYVQRRKGGSRASADIMGALLSPKVEVIPPTSP